MSNPAKTLADLRQYLATDHTGMPPPYDLIKEAADWLEDLLEWQTEAIEELSARPWDDERAYFDFGR